MRDVAQRSAPLTRLRPAPGALVVLLVSSLLLGAPVASVAAAKPNGHSAAEYLASRHGGSASDFELVYERSAHLPDGRRAVGRQARRPPHRPG